MSKEQMLREFAQQRLNAASDEIFDLFESTTAEYEEELCRSKEENERQRKLLEDALRQQHQAADVQQLLELKEEVPTEQQKSGPGGSGGPRAPTP